VTGLLCFCLHVAVLLAKLVTALILTSLPSLQPKIGLSFSLALLTLSYPEPDLSMICSLLCFYFICDKTLSYNIFVILASLISPKILRLRSECWPVPPTSEVWKVATLIMCISQTSDLQRYIFLRSLEKICPFLLWIPFGQLQAHTSISFFMDDLKEVAKMQSL
jgi:hypothetical protein